MIKFTSENIDNKWVDWKFNSVQELADEYFGDADLPANDDYVFDISIDGVKINMNSVLGRTTQFLDLIVLLKIDLYDI